MPLPSFSLTGKGIVIATSTSQSISLSLVGSPTLLIVTNLSANIAYVLLGTSEPFVTSANGVAVLPGQTVRLTLGANTMIAAIGNGPIDFALGV